MTRTVSLATLEEDAISPEEYEAAKEKLIAAYAICEAAEDDDG